MQSCHLPAIMPGSDQTPSSLAKGMTMSEAPPPAIQRPPTIEEVFRQFAPRIYHLARRILGNEADAQDVTQDVMVQVIRKLDTFRGESAFPTWLHRVTVNAALAHRRKKAARHEQPSAEPIDQAGDDHHAHGPLRPWSARPDDALLGEEQQAQVESAMADLPDMYREVFVLSDVEQMSNAEIAEILDLSVPAVKSRLHRARLMMRDRLAPYFEEASA
jgi:RNA polymerase sigma-70 factor, ECF subfamily